MRMRLQKDIDELRKRIISLGALVEERFRMATKAVEYRDAYSAARVIEGDMEIDRLEVDIEEYCLKILALHQPVADQLRYIVAILKMNNDLERIGDLAVNIAQQADTLIRRGSVTFAFDYSTMFAKTEEMLEKSLDSLVNTDLSLAYEVLTRDDDIDSMKKDIQDQFVQEMAKAKDAKSSINLFLISRHLERIADHATNIAEDVIYMISGEIHRHRGSNVIRGSESWFKALQAEDKIS